eukprot:gnl/MRDRNA2_/MRDRNA2_185094_c0_seq1.p1 gnl/MRDRNA2_/MRDRNA2_185094_c0~~gnl/MRDRNA2_/MRDRNA2_185094_c0_seq1.p1  ORF type:complete len:293 (+),score=37.44 gnl/MRDRNA2_/MRDRNA2_185094_c0_seq1:83-961(+)
MAESGDAISNPLLQETLPRNGRCIGKLLAMITLVTLGCSMLADWNDMDGHPKLLEPINAVALPFTQRATAMHSSKPLRPFRPLSPVRYGWMSEPRDFASNAARKSLQIRAEYTPEQLAFLKRKEADKAAARGASNAPPAPARPAPAPYVPPPAPAPAPPPPPPRAPQMPMGATSFVIPPTKPPLPPQLQPGYKPPMAAPPPSNDGSTGPKRHPRPTSSLPYVAPAAGGCKFALLLNDPIMVRDWSDPPQWRLAKLVALEQTEVFVHYEGLGPEFDEWIGVASDRLKGAKGGR